MKTLYLILNVPFTLPDKTFSKLLYLIKRSLRSAAESGTLSVVFLLTLGRNATILSGSFPGFIFPIEVTVIYRKRANVIFIL